MLKRYLIISLWLIFGLLSPVTAIYSSSSLIAVNPVPVTVVSAASYDANAITPDSIVAAFGTLLATQTLTGTDADPNTPLPHQSAKPEVIKAKDSTVSFNSDLDTGALRRLSISPREASQFFLRKRLPKGEKDLPVERYFDAQDQMHKMSVFSTAQDRMLPAGSAVRTPLMAETSSSEAATWTALGPGNIGGRTRALVINPANPNIMYAASVAGGVWKTTNGGVSWNPVSDMIANLAVCSLVLDPTNPNVIYAGTGEGYFNVDSVRGAGIFRSSDGGSTWSQLTGTRTADFYFVNDIVISPSNNKRLYAATGTGVWRTTDSGTTWTKVLDPKNITNNETIKGGCLDLAIRTDQITADVVFASCGIVEQSAIYRSKNAAGNERWDQLLTKEGMGRTALAIAPSNQNIIYAVSANVAEFFYQTNLSNNLLISLQAVFRSTSGGDQGT